MCTFFLLIIFLGLLCALFLGVMLGYCVLFHCLFRHPGAQLCSDFGCVATLKDEYPANIPETIFDDHQIYSLMMEKVSPKFSLNEYVQGL